MTKKDKKAIKKLLKQIVNVINKPGEKGERLCDILTALRDPDMSHSYNLKQQTTEKLRCLMGILQTNNQIGVSTCASIKELKFPEDTEETYHFRNHVIYAIQAFKKLGITRVNNITDERI